MEYRLGYCIVKEPNLNEGSYSVYVTKVKGKRLTNDVIANSSFHDISMILEDHGFYHKNQFVFKGEEKSKTDIDKLLLNLAKSGFKRNLDLEREIELQLQENYAISNSDSTDIPIFDESSNVDFHFSVPTIGILKKDKDEFGEIKVKTKPHRIIEVGEEIDLYMYLFAAPIPTHDKEGNSKLAFEFIGDMFSKNTDELKRFVRICKCTFIRKDNINKKVMFLESKETVRDIIKKIDVLYNIPLMDPNNVIGSAAKEESNSQKNKDLVLYNIMEMKNFLDLDKSIIISASIGSYYNQMRNLSDKIKKEKWERDDRNIPTNLVDGAIQELRGRLKKRMDHHTSREEYETSANYKSAIEYLDEKHKLFELEVGNKKKRKRLISIKEYEKFMNLFDLDF